jgi:uncharacterized protein YndB with AHSA1/START domain
MKSEVEIGGNRVRITRLFDAPRAVIFDWWTQAEKLQRWSGCKDCMRCEIEMDFRVGGGFTQKMQIAGAGQFTLYGTYEEIAAPDRIVYCVNLGPATTRVTVEFSDHGAGTKVVMTHEGLPDEFLCKTVAQCTIESLEKLEAMTGRGTAFAAESR